ncbi:hypothetical protein J8F10_08935 [Gemmata sp. G18]|uniref:Uncharacterized protein n=1 Tax=Gemmata palustris TaxID=2822762 RepID=A0ABS5BNV2_9BACT|nr:hypothetical protein [Gemmata palustris]MBP3955404.1 hypothetical protein [Gemmata palustris]
MRDITNNLLVKRAISPVSVADNTAQVSQIIDRQGFDSLMFAILIGSVADADATFTALLEESDASDLSGGNAVADADMTTQTNGTAPEAAASFQFDDDNEVRKLGYVGNKRYVRLTITPAGNASAAVLAAVAILGHAGQKPVTQSAS